MFNVIVAFKNSERNWQFMFKEEKNAAKIIHEYENGVGTVAFMSITDDFGATALIPFDWIGGILVEDLAKGVDAGVERGMFHLRGQAKTETKMKNDPALKLLAPMNGSALQQRRPF